MKVFKWSTILTLFLLVGCSFMIKPTIWYESEVYHMKRFKVGIENLKRCIVSEVIPAEAQDNFTTLKTDNEELKRKVYESDVYKDYINRQNKIMYQDDKKIIIGDISYQNYLITEITISDIGNEYKIERKFLLSIGSEDIFYETQYRLQSRILHCVNAN